jgi:hypothetical protein
MLTPDFAAHHREESESLICAVVCLALLVPGLPNEKNESRHHARHDQHPILTIETQKIKTLHQKLHRFRPHFLQNTRFACAG